MPKTTNLEALYTNTDFEYPFKIANGSDPTTSPNIAGWALSFLIKKRLTDSDAAAVVNKTTPTGIVVSGTFNATYANNTQIATVKILDTDTVGKLAGVHFYELKRTDPGFEVILANGSIELKQSVHRT